MSARVCGVPSEVVRRLFNRSIHATGFSQWLMTDFDERRIHSAKILEGASPDAPKFFGSAGALPSRKTICHSLFATLRRFARQEPRCRFGSAGASPSHFHLSA
jgi:hypothetical protein